MKRVRDLINESGAGLWGTDKARERLQKDTPGQEIKSLVKKSQKVSEAADPKGTIKVVKQDKVRYITKDELNTYRQMGWKQVEKRPQGDDKIRAAKKAHAAGTWDGNVNKDGKPIVHIDGKPVVVEGYDRAAISAALKKAAEKDNMKSKRDVERFFDYSGGDIIFKMVKDEDEANSLISQFKSQYKQKFNEDAKESIRKRIETMQDEQDRLDVIVQQKQEEKKRIRQQNVDNNTKGIAIKKIDRLIDQIEDRHRRIQIEKELLRDKLSESVQLNELKISFKFDKLADAAKAERKAMQMKKLDVDSEKVQGKNMWLLHVTGSYTDIMKYLKRHDLEDKVHESAEVIKEASYDSIEEGSETWEAGYKRRVVRTTKPEHKEKGYNWRIKGKDKAHLTIKLYKDKPSQAEFNKQMKRVAGHEFGG